MNEQVQLTNMLSTAPEKREYHETGALFDNRIDREWLSTEEAAAYLRLSVGSLRNLTSNGEVPHYKLGYRNRYRLDELRNLLLSNKKGGIHGV